MPSLNSSSPLLRAFGFTLIRMVFMISRRGVSDGGRLAKSEQPRAGEGADMRTWLVGSDVAAIAVALGCCLLVLQRFTSDRWKRRFDAIRSPLIESSSYRVLFLLVVVGVLLISVLPEAAFVLPALDAVGLDIVTIFAALELRHYLTSVAQRVGISTNVAVLETNAILSLYACMWAMIWFRTVLGTLSGPPPTLGFLDGRPRSS